MGSRDKRSKKDRIPPFVAITYEILNSEAYKDLPHAAGKALPFFLAKVKVKVPYKDVNYYLTEFSFSYTEGRRYGFALSTFSNIISALARFGFIHPVEKGGLRGAGLSYNRFRLSKRWIDYGTPHFVTLDWKCFSPKPRVKSTLKKEMNNSKKGNEGEV
jgi:hypothetical protein